MANETISNNSQALELESLKILNIINKGCNQLSIVFSVSGLFCALSIVLTIILTKKLHNKNYFTIACISFSDVILELSYVRFSAANLYWGAYGIPAVYDQLSCILVESPCLLAQALSKGFFLLCAVDRFAAVYKPHWYNSVYPRWIFITLVLGVILQAVADVLILVLLSSCEILTPFCTYTTTQINLNLLVGLSVKNNVVLLSSIFVSVAAIVVIYLRLRMVRRQNGNVREARGEMKTKVLWTLVIMLTSYSTTIVVGSIIYKFVVGQPIEIQLKLGSVTVALAELNPMFDVCVLTWRNRDFRQALLNLVRHVVRRNASTGKNFVSRD